MARLVDVAQRAGVSVSVVSRVLREDATLRIRDETRAAVRAAASELRYTPNHAGRALRLNHAGAIALLVPDVNNAIFSETFRGVEDGASESDLIVLVGRSDNLEYKDSFAARLREQGRIDGLVVQQRDESAAETAARLIPPGTPAVLMNSHDSDQLSTVALDDVGAGRAATQFLLDQGHRDIGLVGGHPQTSTARHREQGYRDALRDAGVKVRPGWTTRLGYTPNDGRAAMGVLLGKPRRPTAVVVSNVNAAVGALFAAREAGVGVPGDLSVVAIHDMWIAEHTAPPLTTVRLPTYALGLEAAHVLARVIAGGSPEHVIVDALPPEVLRRGSHRSLTLSR